jgi:uncharacterized protein YdeI (YjbR/CyaY-like superfamily)
LEPPVDHRTLECLDVVVSAKTCGLDDFVVPGTCAASHVDQSVRCVHYCLYMPRKPKADVADVMFFGSAAEFEVWLAEHVDRRPGVWLKIAKKGSGIPSLTDQEAVDLGLCYGWISGQRKAYDEVYYLQLYVPRRPRSRWSQVNVRRVEALIAAGRMRPSGLAEVEAAKADGRWDAAYESQRVATVPPDLAAALAANPEAGKAFESLNKTDQYAVILNVVTARSIQTRSAHILKAVAALHARGASPAGVTNDRRDNGAPGMRSGR